MLQTEEMAQHARKLKAYALRRVADAALAEDLVQDTFVAALGAQQGESGFRGDSSTYTWLTGILKRKIADHYRSGPQRTSSLEDLHGGDAEDGASGADALEATGAGPERLLENKRLVEAVQKRLDRMPARTARAFLMAEVGGHDASEISAELGISAGNLWVLLHRTRRQLQEALTPALMA